MPADLHEQVESSVLASLDAWFEAIGKNSSTKVAPVASLFGINKLREVARKIDTEQIQDELAIVRTWHADYHTGTLKKDKETSREQAYNQDFFIKILGYKEKPATPYTFEPKATTLRGQLPDAVVGHFDPKNGVENVAAVVELKGASIDLDRPQRREGNLSPVQQAFKYKPLYRKCPFVIVSNFYEFRLYNDNQLDYERWTLDGLVDPKDDYIQFKTWYVLLHANNLTSAEGDSATQALLTDIRVVQEKIGAEFFREYREARLELLRDIYRGNPEIRPNFQVGIEKAQKVVDRIVFACFAEDRGLLPDETVKRLVIAYDASFSSSLWTTLKEFFSAIDKGHARLGIPDGYNGGLFAEDPVLDGLAITDKPLKMITALSRYDFDEDLRVNILGHIFEQSITDLEVVRSKVRVAGGETIEQLNAYSRRKAEGIYYTPEYIVRLIVDGSVGAWLREQEDRLKTKFGLKGDIKDATYLRRERQVYLEYQTVLHNIRVLDPACGSGAFLVHALDYLMAENRRVDAILGADEGIASLFGVEEYVREILNNNLFGVDLNDESVEITKLSLWLKTAERGKKLVTLDKNILCGNSLIDNSKASAKSFDWEARFPEVFKDGGFDVVIGNPPYVSAMDIKKNFPLSEYKHLKASYETAVGTIDLYIYFFEKGIKLLKDGGKLSFISPNRWLSAKYGTALREWIVSNYKLTTLIDYSDKRVFVDASTYPVITFIDKVDPTGLAYRVGAGKIDEDSKLPSLRLFDSSILTIMDDTILGFLLNDKLDITVKTLEQGVSLARVGAINATSTAKEADEFALLINDKVGDRKIVNTGTIDPWSVQWGISKFTKQGMQYMTPYLRFDHDLVSDNRMDLYQSPKILISKIGLRCEAYYDRNGEYASIDTNCIHSFNDDYTAGYVQCWINSKLYNYTFECLFDGLRMQGGYLLYSAPNLRNTRIMPIDVEDQDFFVKASESLQSDYEELQSLDQQFRQVINSGLGIKSIPARLTRWWRMDFVEFVDSLKLKLTLLKSDDLLALFRRYAPQLKAIDSRISDTTSQIDQRLYKLYKLTKAEIAVVETMFE